MWIIKKTPFNTHNLKVHQRGFTLLEVMVAVFVLAVGLLGLAQLQITAMKHNQTAEFRSQASLLAADMLDRMRANQNAAQAGNYALALGSEPPAESNNVAEADIGEWLGNLSSYLPNGDGQIACGAFNATAEFICDITVTWTETQNEGVNYGALGTSSITISGGI
jgi:type IV pilus assembly protein PilV